MVGGLFRVFDAVVIGLTWLASYWMRFNLPFFETTKGFPAFQTYAALTPLIVVLWISVFSSLKLYQSRRILRRTDEAHLILKAHGVALLFFIAITYLFSEYKYSRGVIIYFAVAGAFLLVACRLIVRNALRSLRSRGFNLRHVLAIGEGGSMESLIYKTDKFPELGLRVLGVVTHQSSPSELVSGKKVLARYGSDYTRIRELVRELDVDQVLIALSRQHYADLDEILRALRDETVDIQLVPDIHEYVTLGCAIEDFDGLPLVNLNDSPLDGWGSIAKRFTDFILAGVALIVLSPVLLLLAVLVRVTSPGPVFFKQERMGLDGRTFWMLKFRSMREGAENETGAVWAQKGDVRRTWFGSFLRATSLDELPQFWNVLRGEMSLVGPRPERPVFVQQFRNEIPHYMLRHKVKAGITGWAQINGWRGNTALDRRIECDLYYIRNWSYFLDLKILVLTLWRGFINKNAY